MRTAIEAKAESEAQRKLLIAREKQEVERVINIAINEGKTFVSYPFEYNETKQWVRDLGYKLSLNQISWS